MSDAVRIANISDRLDTVRAYVGVGGGDLVLRGVDGDVRLRAVDGDVRVVADE